MLLSIIHLLSMPISCHSVLQILDTSSVCLATRMARNPRSTLDRPSSSHAGRLHGNSISVLQREQQTEPVIQPPEIVTESISDNATNLPHPDNVQVLEDEGINATSLDSRKQVLTLDLTKVNEASKWEF